MAEFTLDTASLAGIQAELEESIEEIEEESANPEIRKQAEVNAIAIFGEDFESLNSRQEILKPLDEFGIVSMQRSAARNKLLSTRIVDLSKGGDDAGDVGNNLAQLRLQIKDLDPSKLDFAKKGLLGKIFNPMRKYFQKYQKSDAAIADIVKSLDSGSKTLKNDNTTLITEEKTLSELTKKLLADVEMGRAMDAALEAQILKAEYEGADSEKIKFVQEEVLFPLRQRIMDMQQMIVVNQQGIFSMNVIRKNNKELIRGVERAKNVTVTALRTGVIVASALYNQKVLIEKIQTLNETTENIIESTSRMLKEQGAEIHRQSMESTISVDALKKSFADALVAIEDISTFRQNALPQMQQTIEQFREMADEGAVVVSRLEKEGENIS
ncbi:MAG: toxic anion resistance protein [Clostridiales Family XIII bacterium]|jgi:uncharacterized protein YaaN involved in tellurite resistance|nr:toxic anion resistance protein [Clostridiales Family XIII bacterium]